MKNLGKVYTFFTTTYRQGVLLFSARFCAVFELLEGLRG